MRASEGAPLGSAEGHSKNIRKTYQFDTPPLQNILMSAPRKRTQTHVEASEASVRLKKYIHNCKPNIDGKSINLRLMGKWIS